MKKAGSVLCLFAAFCLAPVSDGGGLSILVVDETPADCVCPGTVVGNYGNGGGATCGVPPQPCFVIFDENGTDSEILSGACQFPGNPECPSSACVFPAWKVTMKVSSCAAGFPCGNGPWQAYLPGGGKYGKPLTAGKSIKVPLTLLNQDCRTKTSYTLKLADANGFVEYIVEAKCGKCSRDATPLPAGW